MDVFHGPPSRVAGWALGLTNNIYSLFSVCYSLFSVCYSLFSACYSLFSVQMESPTNLKYALRSLYFLQ